MKDAALTANRDLALKRIGRDFQHGQTRRIIEPADRHFRVRFKRFQWFCGAVSESLESLRIAPSSASGVSEGAASRRGSGAG
jgi:hypothetical protein